METKGIRKQLNDIRIQYESYEITKEKALELGEPLVKKHNKIAMEIAQKYNMKPQLLGMNIEKWYI